MELLERQMILTLKSRFFDIIDTDKSSLQYETLLNEMLKTIQVLMYAQEVTLYCCNEWKQQLFMDASTNKQTMDSFVMPVTPCAELADATMKQSVLRKPIAFPDFKQYDLVLPLKKENKLIGCLALKETKEGTFSQFPNHVLKEFSEECSVFVYKAQNISKIIMEEKRYRQLFRVTEKFHSSMDMDAVLGEIIYTLQEVYPSFTYYLLLSHDNNNHGDLPIKDLEYDSENISAMQAYVTGSIQFEDSLQEKRSILYAPLKGKQGVYGVLQVIAPNTLVFPKNEVEFITLLANTAGSALENAQLYQQSKRLISDLQLINETSHRLNSNLRLTETMTYMAEQICSSFGAEEVGFILISQEHRKVSVIKGSTSFFHTEDSTVYVSYIRDKIVKEKDALFIGDLSLKDQQPEVIFKSIMAVPMVQTGTLKGFALVMHKQPYHFSFEAFKLLQSLIHHSTLAFTNSMLREELETMVVTDHLTKLYSRNFLDERVHRSMEADSQGTFILLDIDNFKSVNDTYGHQVGDDVLIQVAELIKGSIRGTDIGARWGGEELAVYLPKVPLDVGVTIAKRIVKKVAEHTNPRVTISCGVSYWEKTDNDTFLGLFKRADQALYVAKETGKNKVIIQKDLEPPIS
ncbi:diguanylate cyclase [Cytobacillus spongiae]|jgi:diguanylate cyclase (GGDEF)-like protein|uniref:sensor domain-containing diguanylate cyclase n=1 Tax=Cytobacillus spongiae TaxID=2901381 RepID=UPI001F2B0DCA|nr:diguanylate cyclase [Cytobacillus spongiae]UII55196.1 diguanylate cyclase [Cytobacillus spongiae]